MTSDDEQFQFNHAKSVLVCVLHISKADGRRSKFLVRETHTKILVQKFGYKTHTEPAKILVQETWRMTETIKNFKFQFFFQETLHNQQDGKNDEKDETTNNNQQQKM